MSEHYYSEHPQSEVKEETKQFTLLDHTFTFTMSSGVFSKKGIDYGTKLLIENFELPHVEGDLIDLGCGYGPIGISLAYRYQNRNILMIDINERAVQLAEKNAKQNSVRNVEVQQSDGFAAVKERPYAAIVSNPPIRAGKKVIYALFEKSKSYLVDGGELWIVIQKKQGAPSAIEYLSSIYDGADIVARKKGYYIIRARKQS